MEQSRITLTPPGLHLSLYLKINTIVMQQCAITKISMKVLSGMWTSLSRTLSHRIIFNLFRV